MLMDARRLAARLVRVLHEDTYCVVVDKPAGLAVAPRETGESAAAEVVAALIGSGPLHVAWPLEQHVSGILILAKSAEAVGRLRDALAAPSAGCEYTAVLRGRVDKGRRPVTAGPRPRGGSGKATSSKHGRAGQTAPSEISPLQARLISRRQDLSLVTFSHPAKRTAEVRAGVTMLGEHGMLVLGDVPRKGRQPHERPGARIFLHRTAVRFKHPYTNRRVSLNVPPPPVFQAALGRADLIEDVLHTALAARLGFLLDARTDAFRLLVGEAEGAPGLVVEALGPVIILQAHEGKFVGDEDRVRRIAKWYGRRLGASAVYHKQFIKERGTRSRPRRSDASEPVPRGATGLTQPGSEARVDPTPLIGTACPEEYAIEENELRFLVRPYDGLSAGLFLDHRDNRKRVRELSAGRRVLNTFAYTCGFSVAAAAGGAVRTVSVDLSKRALEWGKRNFTANSLPLDDHLFICSEVFEYFKRARRQEQIFDLIILDPPTFSTSKEPRRVFSISSDLEPLIRAALEVLAPDGLVLLSTNNRTRSVAWLKEQAARAAIGASRRFTVLGAPALPPDFAADRDYAKTLLARFA